METPPIQFILEPDQETEARTWWGAARDLKEGDVIEFTDAKGTAWRATVTGVDKKSEDLGGPELLLTIPLQRVDDPQEA